MLTTKSSLTQHGMFPGLWHHVMPCGIMWHVSITSVAAILLACRRRSRLVRKNWAASDSCPSERPDDERPEGSLKGPLLLIIYSLKVSKLSICSGVAYGSKPFTCCNAQETSLYSSYRAKQVTQFITTRPPKVEDFWLTQKHRSCNKSCK